MKGRFEMSLLGKEDVMRAIEAAGDRAAEAMRAGIYAVGETIIKAAKRRAPVDTGTMRGSGYVTLPTASGRTVECEIGFGGPAKSYVAEQHENTKLRHAEGEARFLAKALEQVQGTALGLVGRVALAAFKAAAGVQRGSNPTDPNDAPKKARSTKRRRRR